MATKTTTVTVLTSEVINATMEYGEAKLGPLLNQLPTVPLV